MEHSPDFQPEQTPPASEEEDASKSIDGQTARDISDADDSPA